MPRGAMTRRQVLASSAKAAALLALGGPWVTARLQAAQPVHVRTYFDPRFPRSEWQASELPQATRPLAVRGDPTDLVMELSSRPASSAAVRLQGVTTEAIPFCLEQYTRHDTGVRFASQRVNRDLFAWSLELPARGPLADMAD